MRSSELTSTVTTVPALQTRPVVSSAVVWTVKLPVKHHTKNANTDVISSQPITCPSEQSRSRSRVFHRPGGSEVRSSELASSVIPVPALQTRLRCR